MRATHVAAVAALVLVLALAPTAGAEPDELGPCGAPAEHPGGEWRSYGHDPTNSRSQPLEAEIGPDTVGDLDVAWVHTSNGATFHATPVVADGCVYIGADNVAYALDADTGSVVWETTLEGGPSSRGHNIVGSFAVDDEHVYVAVNLLGRPYVTALDRLDGAELWTSPIDDQEIGFGNASVVLFDGLILAGISVTAEADPPGRGGYAILDAETGELLVHRYVIPDDDYEAGYAGASIWSTAAVDEATGHAYVGTSNPHSTQHEHELTNALIKIDLDEERDTFGEIVAAYKGLSDSYVDGLHRQPACEQFGDDITYGSGFSVTCAQLDIDFGASPNLFPDSRGNLRVGALQKSGVYHVADAATMSRIWTTVVGLPCMICNGSSAAFHGDRIHVAAVPPGQMYGLARDDGDYDWVAPLGDLIHYQPVSAANGVVYTTDSNGLLRGFDAESGQPVLQRSMRDDTGVPMTDLRASGGIAIARNTLYVAATSHVIAYRP